ncbi:MAG: hypothetical protein JXR77_14515, partial [Lentisphaeria bacterium]|nr:hypothetical protein [Lentisphaeria bacterium]
TVRPAPGYGRPAFYENAFLAFGTGTQDTDLVKVGIKFIRSTAVVLSGETRGRTLAEQSLAPAAALPCP